MDERERLERLEAILGEYGEIIEVMNAALDRLEGAAEGYEALKAYYTSEDYLNDYESSTLDYRVTSQDGIFDVIEDRHELALRMLDVATALIREV